MGTSLDGAGVVQLRSNRAGSSPFQRTAGWRLESAVFCRNCSAGSFPGRSVSVGGQRWPSPAMAMPWCSPFYWKEPAEAHDSAEDALLALYWKLLETLSMKGPTCHLRRSAASHRSRIL